MADDRFPDKVYDRASQEMDDDEKSFMAVLTRLGVFRNSPNMDVALHGESDYYVESSIWMDKAKVAELWAALAYDGLDYKTDVIVNERGPRIELPEGQLGSTEGDAILIYPEDGIPARADEFDPSWLVAGKEYSVSFFLQQDTYVYAENAYEDMLEDGSLPREEMNAWLEEHGRGYRV